jgi:hypothetical protein
MPWIRFGELLSLIDAARANGAAKNTPFDAGASVLSKLLVVDGTTNGHVTVTYSTSITLDAALGHLFSITASDGVGFAINAPSNPVLGQRITIRIRNTSGGALGTATFNAIFKMATWTQPADTKNRSIEFEYDGVNWVEVSRTAADVPN